MKLCLNLVLIALLGTYSIHAGKTGGKEADSDDEWEVIVSHEVAQREAKEYLIRRAAEATRLLVEAEAEEARQEAARALVLERIAAHRAEEVPGTGLGAEDPTLNLASIFMMTPSSILLATLMNLARKQPGFTKK